MRIDELVGSGHRHPQSRYIMKTDKPIFVDIHIIGEIPVRLRILVQGCSAKWVVRTHEAVCFCNTPHDHLLDRVLSQAKQVRRLI